MPLVLRWVPFRPAALYRDGERFRVLKQFTWKSLYKKSYEIISILYHDFNFFWRFPPKSIEIYFFFKIIFRFSRNLPFFSLTIFVRTNLSHANLFPRTCLLKLVRRRNAVKALWCYCAVLRNLIPLTFSQVIPWTCPVNDLPGPVGKALIYMGSGI